MILFFDTRDVEVLRLGLLAQGQKVSINERPRSTVRTLPRYSHLFQVMLTCSESTDKYQTKVVRSINLCVVLRYLLMEVILKGPSMKYDPSGMVRVDSIFNLNDPCECGSEVC